MEFIMLPLLALLLVFMFYNTRKRQKQMKQQQEEKASQTVPGVKVLLQGGLYGTIVSYDPVDLDKPAEVEIAPGVVIEVHSQGILRIVEPTEHLYDDEELDDSVESEEERTIRIEDMPDPMHIETPEETRARLDRDSEN